MSDKTNRHCSKKVEVKNNYISANVSDATGSTEVIETSENMHARKHYQICGAGLASRIHKYIVHAILPKLHKLLTQKVKTVLVLKMLYD